MDEIISNIASVNWEIQGLLQDNTTKTYHVIAVLNETYSWSETLLNDKSTDHNQLSKLIESEVRIAFKKKTAINGVLHNGVETTVKWIKNHFGALFLENVLPNIAFFGAVSPQN